MLAVVLASLVKTRFKRALPTSASTPSRSPTVKKATRISSGNDEVTSRRVKKIEAETGTT